MNFFVITTRVVPGSGFERRRQTTVRHVEAFEHEADAMAYAARVSNERGRNAVVARALVEFHGGEE